MHTSTIAASIGYTPVPRWRGNEIAPNWEKAEGVSIATGQRADGLYLVRLDIDYQVAETLAALDAIAPQLALQRSTSGRGYDLLFLTRTPIASGSMYRGDGLVGELFCVGRAGRAHIDRPFLRRSLDTIPVLTADETAAVLQLVGYCAADTDRAALRRLGDSLTSGFDRHTSPAAVEAMLVDYCGTRVPRIFAGEKKGQFIGRQLWQAALGGDGDRSAVYASLVQSLALHALSLGATNTERWQRVRALAEHTGAGGKAREKTYSIARDTAAIIGKVATGAPRDSGGCFTVPRWYCDDGLRPTPASESSAPAPRPPGRPSGDRDKMLAKLRRALAAIEPDAFGRVVFSLEALQADLGRKRRSVQGYLADLRKAGEISETGQVEGNGDPYVVLLADFGGANKYPKEPRSASDFGGATPIAPERTLMPESPVLGDQVNREGDHQNPCAPPVEAVAAPPCAEPAAPLAELPRAPERPQGAAPFGDPLPAPADPGSLRVVASPLFTPVAIGRGDALAAMKREQSMAARPAQPPPDRPLRQMDLAVVPDDVAELAAVLEAATRAEAPPDRASPSASAGLPQGGRVIPLSEAEQRLIARHRSKEYQYAA